MNQNDLQAYIDVRIQQDGGQMPTMEKLNSYVAEFVQAMNSSAKARFEGLSSQQMFEAIHRPFGEQSPVQFNKLTDNECNLSPILRQAKLLLKCIEEAGELKLTAIGNLPPKIVKEIYPLGIGDWYIDAGMGKLSKETDSMCVHLTRITLEIAGIIKKRNNKLSLTATGKKLMADDYALFSKMFTAYFEKFNWEYLDRYEFDNLGRFAVAFTFVLLAKYGDERKLGSFYADKFFAAFPSLIEDYECGSEYNSTDSYLSSCYRHRLFEYSLNFWGLINYVHQENTPNFWITKTELFDRLIKFIPTPSK
ncbi:hypothetical protein BN938_2499 [Mucinivorans hirudinis]|uniref:Uncharacterized protein n=1 Tax=Mucinivorans hirudinis TaxID=1433126 RepID=A0A060REC2_9BACT|nr:hypothetical protein BN938_2499 [Mucinivorans hirudinis]